MACIFKRGKTWSYSVDLGRDESGKRKKKGKGGFRTQKEAKEAAAIIEAEIAGGIFIDEKKITFDELAEQWLGEHSKELKPTSLGAYKYALIKLKSILANYNIKDITKMQYQKTLSLLFEKNVSFRTLQLVHTVSKMIFNYACKYDLLKNNPTIYAKIPKTKESNKILEENEIPKYLEKIELKTFLKTVKKNEPHDYYLIFLILAYTGMRRGELTALKWSDIDFNAKTININKTIILVNGKLTNYILQPPKTKTSKRKIMITDNVLQELIKFRLSQKQQQMLHRQNWHDENFIFTSPTLYGYPFDARQIWVVMKRNLKRATLNNTLSPHSLRHTHTSLLAEAGVTLEAIMERLGHSNDNTTRTIYLHITQEVKKDAAQKFYELMKDTESITVTNG